jgi:hypothetical protein
MAYRLRVRQVAHTYNLRLEERDGLESCFTYIIRQEKGRGLLRIQLRFTRVKFKIGDNSVSSLVQTAPTLQGARRRCVQMNETKIPNHS